jgi:uncharacterized protein (TIGR02265 family)
MVGGDTSRGDDSGLGTEMELQRRLSLATPADTLRGLSIDTALETVRTELGDEAMESCLVRCTEKSFKSFFSYPVSEYLNVLYPAARLLSARYSGFDNAVRRISGGFTPSFLSSTVGKAFMLFTTQGPKHLLNNIPVAFRAAASIKEVSVVWTGPRSGVLLTQKDFLLYLNHEGALMGLFRALRLPGARVRGRQVGTLDNEVEFSWD